MDSGWGRTAMSHGVTRGSARSTPAWPLKQISELFTLVPLQSRLKGTLAFWLSPVSQSRAWELREPAVSFAWEDVSMAEWVCPGRSWESLCHVEVLVTLS